MKRIILMVVVASLLPYSASGQMYFSGHDHHSLLMAPTIRVPIDSLDVRTWEWVVDDTPRMTLDIRWKKVWTNRAIITIDSVFTFSHIDTVWQEEK